jgi:predicted metal-binding protein
LENIEESLAWICKRAMELGASDAKAIKASDVEVKDWVFYKCKFGCDGFGQTLTCPPHSPSPEAFRKVLSGYEWAVLLKFDGFDIYHQDRKLHDVIADLEREVFLAGFFSAYGLACGPCPYCTECNMEHCTHADRARPSMEASGIDVYTTARKAGFSIHVVKTEDDKPTYFSLLLVQ